jgi:hypothetical protein
VTRKGEILQARLRHQWPHHVALWADKVRGHKNYDVVHTFAKAFSVGPRTFWARRDDVDVVVFCFAKPEDAAAFCEQFGGQRLPSIPGDDVHLSGATDLRASPAGSLYKPPRRRVGRR